MPGLGWMSSSSTGWASPAAVAAAAALNAGSVGLIPWRVTNRGRASPPVVVSKPCQCDSATSLAVTSRMSTTSPAASSQSSTASRVWGSGQTMSPTSPSWTTKWIAARVAASEGAQPFPLGVGWQAERRRQAGMLQGRDGMRCMSRGRCSATLSVPSTSRWSVASSGSVPRCSCPSATVRRPTGRRPTACRASNAEQRCSLSMHED